MLGGSGTTTFQGGHVLFMSRRKCLLEFVNIIQHPNKPNHHCFWQAPPTPPWSSRFVLSFTKSITGIVVSGVVSVVSLCWKCEAGPSSVARASTASEHCTAETPAAVPNLNQSDPETCWVGIIVGSTPSEWEVNLVGGWACEEGNKIQLNNPFLIGFFEVILTKLNHQLSN